MTNQQIQIQSELKSFGIEVLEKMTTTSRPGKLPRSVWVVSGNIFGMETIFRDLNGKKFRGQWSFFENPSESILNKMMYQGRLSFSEQIENQLDRKIEKANRYHDYAKSAQQRATTLSQKASEMSSFIPMGQPILVGHHSENRHRKDLQRIDKAIHKSIEEISKSEYYSVKVDNLKHAKSRLENREFVGNRIEESKKELGQLIKWADSQNPKLMQVQEKLTYWQNRMTAIETKLIEAGCKVPSSESIKVGDEVEFIGWFPVVKINQKTVTVSHWLGVESFKYMIPYSKIKSIRHKSQS